MSKFEDAFTLPCGLVLKNRLVKAALAETLCNSRGTPGAELNGVYEKWAQGGWGMVLTGHVMVDEAYRAASGDPIARMEDLSYWKEYAKVCCANGTAGIVQINHPGRQCPRGSKTPWCNIAPSAKPLVLGPTTGAKLLSKAVFGMPREMNAEDIAHVVQKFVSAAVLAESSGFQGVEIHAAHGYLLSSFLSAKSNDRSDHYGGTPENRARIVQLIIEGIRRRVKPSFAVGFKVNSADASGEMEDTMAQLKFLVASGGVDFIELSGGSYENPLMFQSRDNEAKKEMKESTKIREAYFAAFAKELRAQIPRHIAVLLTGGFRSRMAMKHAVEVADICDLIGVGRPACVDPCFAKGIIFNKALADEDACLFLGPTPPPPFLMRMMPSAVGASHATKVYRDNLERMGKGQVMLDNRL